MKGKRYATEAKIRILRVAGSTFSYLGRKTTTAEEQMRKRLHGLSVDRGVVTVGRLAGGQAAHPKAAALRRAARATGQTQGEPTQAIHLSSFPQSR